MPNYSESEIQEANEEYRKVIKDISLRRFKQAVYTVITRYRASKRIVKLRILKKEILRTRGMNNFLPRPEDMYHARNIKKMSLSGEVKDDHRHSLLDDELQRLKSLEIHEERLAADGEGVHDPVTDKHEPRKSFEKSRMSGDDTVEHEHYGSPEVNGSNESSPREGVGDPSEEN